MAEERPPDVIKLKTNLTWDTSVYLKNDPEQNEYMLSGVIIRPGKGVQFLLTDLMGEESSYWDHMVTFIPDELKRLSAKKDDDDVP